MSISGKLTIIFFSLSAVLIIMMSVLYFNDDHLAPKISFSSNDVSYHTGMSEAELLSGVTASDMHDGDVTSSIVVEKIVNSSDGSKVTVVYAARDRKNNITKASRVFSIE